MRQLRDFIPMIPAAIRNILLMIGILASASLVIAACSSDSETRSDISPHRYENQELGFAFEYPVEWEKITEQVVFETSVGDTNTVASVMFGPGQETTAGINIEVNRLEEGNENLTIEDLTVVIDDLVAQGIGSAGGAITERDYTQLGGFEARRYKANFSNRGVPTTTAFITAVRQGYQFNLNCEAPSQAFDDIRSGCQTIFDSFEFVTK